MTNTVCNGIKFSNFLTIINFLFKKVVIKPFKDQVFEELSKQHNHENLFEDHVFPANANSLYYSSPRPSCIPQEEIVWKRASVSHSII